MTLRILLSALVLSLASLSASGQTADPAKSEPRLPGAVEALPAWLEDAPFDAVRFFEMPPASENAAPLYLDALFEFGPELAACFPPSRRDRAGIARARSDRMDAIYSAWNDDPKSVSTGRIDGILAEFGEGLRKLDLAQRRPRCVFATGLTDNGLPSHAQVARAAARVLRLRVERDVDRADFDSAIADIGRMLRISRDVRPRGGLYSQLVGIAIDGSAANDAILSVLANPKLTVDQCDRLLKLLAGHEARAIDPYSEGVKMQFILDRSFVRLLGEGIRTTVDGEGRPVETKVDRRGILKEVIPTLLASEIAGDLLKDDEPKQPEGPNPLININEIANRMIDDAEKDPRWGDRFTRSLLASKATNADRTEALEAWRKPKAEGGPPAWFNLASENYRVLIQSCSRDAVYLGAARCLVALRRWQRTRDAAPTDLAEVCRAAGLAIVPFDPFSGSSLKMTTVDGEQVIYSVGDDGRDDHALKDAQLGRKAGTEGDFIFRASKRR